MLEFLREYHPFFGRHSVQNTFSRVCAALDLEEFCHSFISWAKSLQSDAHEVIAIDGKTLRNSADERTGRAAIHMVSTFATNAKLILGQKVVICC